jgi:hypothetical protein
MSGRSPRSCTSSRTSESEVSGVTFSRESALEELTDSQQARVYALACAQALLADEFPEADLLIKLAVYIDTGQLLSVTKPLLHITNPVPSSGEMPRFLHGIRVVNASDVRDRVS